MAKRFTATEKWDDPFFAELSMENKLIWLFLLDKCNHAGIWDVNKRLLEFSIGAKIDLDETLKTFGDRIEVLESGKWFISKFVEFQYASLNEKSRTHQSVLAILKKERVSKGYPKGIQTLTVTDTDNCIKTIKKEEDEKSDYPHLDLKFPLAHCDEVAKKDETWVRDSGYRDKWPTMFLKYLKGIGETEKHIGDYKKHFFNWKRKHPDYKPSPVL